MTHEEYVVKFLDRAIEDFGSRISMPRVKALAYAWLLIQNNEDRTCTASEVALAAGVSQPTVSRLAAQLIDKGYVEIVPGDDSRELALRITERGASRRVV